MSSDMIEILVLIAIAGVVLFRLKSVIGTRTGHEGPPEVMRRQQNGADAPARPGPVAVPDLPEEDEERFANVPEDSHSALEAIRQVEPDFDIDGFVDGDECFEEGLHLSERPRIRAVGQRPRRIGMGLHKDTGNPGGNRRPRQNRHELTLATACLAFSSR